jgi:hypothetical protein
VDRRPKADSKPVLRRLRVDRGWAEVGGARPGALGAIFGSDGVVPGSRAVLQSLGVARFLGAVAVLLGVQGGLELRPLPLQLGHLALDVHQLADVVAGLGPQRADPEVGQAQVLEVGLVPELVQGVLGGQPQPAQEAPGLPGHLGQPLRPEQQHRDQYDGHDLAQPDVEHA